MKLLQGRELYVCARVDPDERTRKDAEMERRSDDARSTNGAAAAGGRAVSAPQAPRRQARGVARRRAILDAALRLAAEHGPDALTMRAVAEEAGVPLGLTTYYFASRDDLIGQALERAAESELEVLEPYAASLSRPTVAQVADDIAAFICDAGGLTGQRTIAHYELWLQIGRRPALRPLAERQQAALLELGRRVLRELGATYPDRDARVLISAMDGLALQRTALGTPSRAEVTRDAERVLRLLAPGAP